MQRVLFFLSTIMFSTSLFAADIQEEQGLLAYKEFLEKVERNRRLQEGGDIYKPDPVTEEFRKKADQALDARRIIPFFQEESHKAPNLIKIISLLPEEDDDMCYTYAFTKTLGHEAVKDLKESNSPCASLVVTPFISEHFVETHNPHNGALAVYYNRDVFMDPESQITHAAIKRDNDLVESKWSSTKAIFLHPKFYTLPLWGNEIRYYTPKKH